MANMRAFFFLFLVTLLCMLPTNGVVRAVTLDSVQENIDISQYMDVLEDPTGKLTLEEVRTPEYAPRFIRNTLDPPNFGRTRSTYWLRIDVSEQDDKNWYLLVDNPIYQIDAWPKNQLERLPYRTPLFHLKRSSDQARTIYLRVYNGQALLYLPTRLMTGRVLLRHTIVQYGFFISILAGLGVLLVYNLFLYQNLREPSYIAIIGFTAAAGFCLSQDNGFITPLGLPFVFNDILYLDGIFYNAPLLSLLSLALYFWKQISQKSDHFVDSFCRWGSLITLLAIPLSGWWVHSRTIISATALLIVVIVAPLFIRQVLNAHRLATRTFSALIILLTMSSFYLLEQAGLPILSHQMALYLQHIGILLTITLLSITQTEHIRILREAKERSDATSKAKDAFLTTMSHELRTPMNSVVAATNLLKQGQLPPQELGYITRMESASHHMLGLIDNILDLSRLEQTSLTLYRESFLLDKILNDVQQILELQATTKNLHLTIHVSTPQGLQLYGDPKRLSQVLVNLLGNAVKFTETGSVNLYVRAQNSVNEDSIGLYFEIADTGIGIPPQDQLHLFQPFHQVDSKRTRHYRGSGLGLAISHKLVEIMGGKLEMESSPGKGSRFFFTLNFDLSTSMQEPPTDAPLAPIDNIQIEDTHILLVDDDEMNQFFGRELLNRLGTQTTIASSGAEAIQQIQQQTFDLVFMDISMPDMDGYETTRKIRTASKRPDIPIIALTAHAIAGEKERCLEAGMDDYLAKPFSLSEMETMIRRWSNIRNVC